MHRLTRLIHPSQRSLASLSQATSRSSSASPSPLPPSVRPLVHELVDFYDDDLMNEIHAPDVLTEQSPRKMPTRLNDAYLYGPADDDAYNRQLALEEETVSNAVERFRKMTLDASRRGDVATHRSANDLLLAWHNPLILAIRDSLRSSSATNTSSDASLADPPADEKSVFHSHDRKRPRASERSRGRRSVQSEVNHIMHQLPPESLAIIIIHTLLSSLMRDPNGVPLTRSACIVADAVRAEVNMKKLVSLHRNFEHEEKKRQLEQGKPLDFSQSPRSTLDRFKKSSLSLASAVNYATAKLDDKEHQWSSREQVLLGTRLIDLFMSIAKVLDSNNQFVPAIVHTMRYRKSSETKVGMLQLTDAAVEVLKQESSLFLDSVQPKQQPMVVPPRPWTSPNDGAYLRCNSYLVKRSPGSHREVEKLLQSADLTELYNGLNVLGSQPWRVNRAVFDVAKVLWDRGGGIAGLVTKTNCEVPEKKQFIADQLASFEKKKLERELWGPHENDDEDCDVEEFDEKLALRKLRSERKKAQKLNRELVSLRAETEHRMRQAHRFCGEDRIWLPHNVDFRGRAYPMSVHLQHMGCDLTRALLTFAKPGIPLGERGVYWLKVHLANMLGGDKLSYRERIDLAEDNMQKAIKTGRSPLKEPNLEWWSSAEDPFQLLAVCCEIAEAVGRHGGRRSMETHESTLPISMDGSCNGLQHYAALGRDVEGGTQVNLVPSDRPQDVYTGIAKLVGDKVDHLAAQGDEFGLLMRGKVSRKVVKQTVMTSVYGVTPIGARQQIMNRLAEIQGIPEDKIFGASCKLAKMTLSSLGDIFQGATETMSWLYESAQRISKMGHKVQWTTPVGLPVLQPYRRHERKVVRTLMQRVTLQKSGEHSPVATERQRSAFPPNFVHSIDSAHMLFTAMKCSDNGLQFASVHDSFWTNAAHVDVLHRVLRDEFIELHSRDLLRELRESFLLRYDDVELEELPSRGKLDLSVVRDSPYFFS